MLFKGSVSDSAEKLVAMSANGSMSWTDLNEKIDQWDAYIEKISEPYILVRQPRGDELLACLLAVWRKNKVAVLSTSKQHLEPDLSIDSHAWLQKGLVRGLVLELSIEDVDEDMALVLFTSGSSGKPIAVSKTFKQLDAELRLLEQMWGSQVGNSVFVSTVSRHHMYGLPFGLLWPAARNNAFLIDTVNYAESLETLSDQFPITLITSPVQLANLPENLNWGKIKKSLVKIFSAGAPLSRMAASNCQQKLLAATEIYGSTETGAVAWQQHTENSYWRCLPGVQIKADQESQAYLKSPCLRSDASWVSIADKVKLLSSNTFQLLGRIDRVVKVGGKRISLTEIESLIKRHSWVEDVRALMLEERKSRIAAVLILNAEGRARLIDEGAHVVNQIFSRSIAGHVDSVAIPRYWRYLNRLPQDAQGKISVPLLKTLFFPKQQPRLPEILEQHSVANGNEVSIECRIPENLFYFNGHFSGNPILPGVVQVKWVEHYGRQKFKDVGKFLRIEKLKFQHIIQPEDIITLKLSWDEAKFKLTFSYSSKNEKYSSGHLIFASNIESVDV